MRVAVWKTPRGEKLTEGATCRKRGWGEKALYAANPEPKKPEKKPQN